jgi:hypothetical protein
MAFGKHNEINPTMAQLLAIRERRLAEACRHTLVRPDDDVFGAAELGELEVRSIKTARRDRRAPFFNTVAACPVEAALGSAARTAGAVA